MKLKLKKTIAKIAITLAAILNIAGLTELFTLVLSPLNILNVASGALLLSGVLIVPLYTVIMWLVLSQITLHASIEEAKTSINMRLDEK